MLHTVILAHNHPAGLAIPSSEDVTTSYSIKAALINIGIVMIDHFLVADGKCVPILRTVEKGRKKNEIQIQSQTHIQMQNCVIKAPEFELDDDFDYDLLENIDK